MPTSFFFYAVFLLFFTLCLQELYLRKDFIEDLIGDENKEESIQRYTSSTIALNLVRFFLSILLRKNRIAFRESKE